MKIQVDIDRIAVAVVVVGQQRDTGERKKTGITYGTFDPINGS